MPRFSKFAFTLVELLTVIAIIGVLAALLLPVVGKFVVRAQEVACVGNLRQIGAAFMMYVSENNGYLPASGSGVANPPPANGNRTGQNWWGEIGPLMFAMHREDGTTIPFMEFSQMMCCPSYLSQFLENETAATTSHPGYGMNIRPFAQQGDWTTPNRERAQHNAVLFPARSVMVAESYKSMNFSPTQTGEFATRPPTLGNNPEVHEGHANYLFYDGHIEALTPEAAVEYVKLRKTAQ